MGRRINPKERIVQKSVGFKFRQIEFLNEHPDFRPDEFCREAVDAQIEIIDPRFLGEKYEKRT